MRATHISFPSHLREVCPTCEDAVHDEVDRLIARFTTLHSFNRMKFVALHVKVDASDLFGEGEHCVDPAEEVRPGVGVHVIAKLEYLAYDDQGVALEGWANDDMIPAHSWVITWDHFCNDIMSPLFVTPESPLDAFLRKTAILPPIAS